MRRADQRRAAVFAVYRHDVTGRSLDEQFERDDLPFTKELARATVARQGELDALIDSHAHGWDVERIQPLERAIMRVALLEMLYGESVPAHAPIPPEGAIEEAVETAKTFCSDRAPGFLNGVLAAILRDVRENASAA